MFARIGFIAPQNEILFMPAHHQHAGTDFGIGDGIDELFDGMHAVAHGALKALGRREAQFRVLGDQRLHAVGIGRSTLRERFEPHPGLRCSLVCKMVQRLPNPPIVWSNRATDFISRVSRKSLW